MAVAGRFLIDEHHAYHRVSWCDWPTSILEVNAFQIYLLGLARLRHRTPLDCCILTNLFSARISPTLYESGSLGYKQIRPYHLIYIRQTSSDLV